MRIAHIGGSLVIASVMACSATWTVDDDALSEEPTDGRLVVTRYRDGACTEEVVYWTAARSGDEVVPLDLEAGEYCFYVYRWDDACSSGSQGWGVTEGVSLPTTGEIETTLRAGCEGPCIAACAPPVLLWPPEASHVRTADVGFRVQLVPRVAPHHPRPDRLILRVEPCETEECGDRDDPLELAGETPAIRVEDDETEWLVPIDEVPELEDEGRLAWHVDACFGDRCVRSPTRYFFRARSADDLDGDGLEDITIGDVDRGIVHFYRTGLLGDFAQSLPADTRCNDALGVLFDAVGDHAGTGLPQIAVSRVGCSRITTFARNAASGSVSALDAIDLPAPILHIAGAADVDADGSIDLVVATEGGVVLVGAAGVVSLTGPPTPSRAPAPIAGGGDFDADGFSDFVVLGRTETVLCFGGTLAESISVECVSVPVPLETSERGVVLLAADANDDGFADLVVAGSGPTGRAVWTVSGNADRAVAEVKLLGPFDDAGSMSVGDVNEDGLSDLLVGRPNANEADLYLGAPGEAPFATAPTTFSERAPYPIGAAGMVKVREFGRAVSFRGGTMGARRFDLMVSRVVEYPAIPGLTAAIDVAEVRLYEWSERTGPRHTFTLTSPGIAAGVGELGFGGVL